MSPYEVVLQELILCTAEQGQLWEVKSCPFFCSSFVSEVSKSVRAVNGLCFLLVISGCHMKEAGGSQSMHRQMFDEHPRLYRAILQADPLL